MKSWKSADHLSGFVSLGGGVFGDAIMNSACAINIASDKIGRVTRFVCGVVKETVPAWPGGRSTGASSQLARCR